MPPKQQLEAAPGPAAENDPALLLAVLSRDWPAFQAALQRSCPLSFGSVTALHAAALAGWPEAVGPLLAASGELLEQKLDFCAAGAREEGEVKALLAPLGLTQHQLDALLPPWHRKAPLLVAVSCNAAEVALQLVAAGADVASSCTHLVDLAEALTAAAGGPSTPAAVADVPAAVQRMAEALMSGGVDPAPAINSWQLLSPVTKLHEAAVALALPHRQIGSVDYPARFPPCPWLLDHLFQLHSAGGPLAVPAGVEGVTTVLKQLPDRPGEAAEAALKQWLSLPAALTLGGRELLSLAGRLLDRRMHLGTLPLLLERQEVRDALVQTADATQLTRFGSISDFVVAAAAAAGAPLLDAVLAAGGGVSLSALHSVLQHATEGGPSTLRLLLSCGVPLVPGDDEPAHLESCPLYAVLQHFHEEQEGLHEHVCVRVLDAGELASIGTTRQRALAAHLTHLEMMEALVEAGYRPVTYRRCKGPYTGTELANYFPPGDPKVARRWELDSAGRWLWRAALHEPWSTATHSSFPPAFKAAARSLLLAANRSRTAAARAAAACRSRRSQRLRDRTAAAAGSHEGVSPLGTLPPGVLLHVLGLSAYPLSAWKPEPDGGSLWQTLRELWEENNPLLHPLTF